MNVNPEARSWNLAAIPGFHSLARTQVVGYGRAGTARLRLWCACEPDEAIAEIVVALTPRGDEFRYIERGRGVIEVVKGIDTQTDHGHFVLEGPWQTDPDGWQTLGIVERGGHRKGVSGSVKLDAKPSRLKKAIESNAPCACGHERGLHDPCSRCLCPAYHVGSPKKYARRKA